MSVKSETRKPTAFHADVEALEGKALLAASAFNQFFVSDAVNVYDSLNFERLSAKQQLIELEFNNTLDQQDIILNGNAQTQLLVSDLNLIREQRAFDRATGNFAGYRQSTILENQVASSIRNVRGLMQQGLKLGDRVDSSLWDSERELDRSFGALGRRLRGRAIDPAVVEQRGFAQYDRIIAQANNNAARGAAQIGRINDAIVNFPSPLLPLLPVDPDNDNG